MTLAVNVNRLVRTHLTTGPNNKPVQVPALLEQLDKAITEQTTRGGEGSGGPAIPVGVGALSLRQDIERELRRNQHERVGNAVGTTAGILHAWATLDGEWADYLEHVTLGWCDQIMAIVAPTKPPRRLHQPCPSCGVLYGGDDMKAGLLIHCWDTDGGMLQVGEWTAECVHCGAAWANEEMTWLRKAINV